GAYTGRVGFADSEHIVDGVWTKARTCRGLRGHRIGRGDERIGAVIDVEQRTLRTLEQNTATFAALVVEQRPDAVHVRQNFRRDARKLVKKRAGLDLAHAKTAPKRIVMRKQPLDLAVEHLQVGKIHQTNGPAANLVLIGRADAAAGGADRPFP